ncbi:hypothetical protein [Aquipuribacter nitratireducens]|uniref:PH domain-containing protein n=1 Tax=Aquipuribacter nitratireducens TaxID=650104 RepID=A0ABW0GR31_9MICO
MSQAQAATLFLLVVPVLFGLMYLGWRGRARRQSDVAAPATAPAGVPAGAPLPEPLLDPVEGVYVSTVRAGDWLDRVVVHGLGVRSPAVLHAGRDGVWFERRGAPGVFVPAAAVESVRLESGMAGKYTVGEELLVLRWRSGDAHLDTGFRPQRWSEASRYAAALQPLVTGGDQ